MSPAPTRTKARSGSRFFGAWTCLGLSVDGRDGVCAKTAVGAPRTRKNSPRRSRTPHLLRLPIYPSIHAPPTRVKATMLRKQATGTAFHLELPLSLEPVRVGEIVCKMRPLWSYCKINEIKELF